MHTQVWDGTELCRTEEWPVEETAVGWTWRNQQVLSLDEVNSETRFEQCMHYLRERGMHSYCVLPLTSSQLRFGSLGVASAVAGTFRSSEVQFLRRVADLVALSLDETQISSSLLEEKARVTLLRDISRVLERVAKQQPLELHQRFSLFLEPLQSWAGPSYVGLYVYDQNAHALRLYTREPRLGPWLAAGGMTPLEGSVAGRAFRERKPEILDSADLSRLSFATVRRGMELGVKSLCMLPVFQRGEAVGVLKIACRTDRTFSPRDIDALSEVAGMAAAAMQVGALASVSALEEVEQTECQWKVSNGPTWRETSDAQSTSRDHRASAKVFHFASAEAGGDLANLLADYFSSSTVGLCVLDSELRYLAINNALARMNGVPAPDHLGKSIFEVMGDVAAKIEPAMRAVLSTGEPVLNLELTGTLPTASAPGRWLETYFPIRDSQGGVSRIGVAVMEITERHMFDESVRRLTERLQQERTRLQVLREIGVALTRHLDLKELFAATARCLEKAIPFDFAGIWLYQEEQQTMRAAAVDSRVGELFQEGEAVTLDQCMLGQSMLAGKPGTVDLAELETLPFAQAKRLLRHGLKSMCSIPLITPKGPVGGLGLACRDDRAFSAEDVALLSQAASSIALAAEIAVARETLRNGKERLQALSDISKALTGFQSDFRQTFPAVSACIRKIVRYDMAALLELNPVTNMVQMFSLDSPPDSGFDTDQIIPLERSILGQMEGHKGRNFAREELEVQAGHVGRIRHALDEGLQSLCCVPLITPRGMLGALVLARKDPTPFTQQDLDFLNRLASELALSLESATAHEALNREKERLQALREIDSILVANAHLETLIPQVSAAIGRAVPHRHIGIHIYDEKAQVLRDQADGTAAKSKMFPGGVVPIDASVAGEVLMERKARVLDYEKLAKVPYPIAKRAIEQGVRSICFIPLLTLKGPLGVMVLSSHTDHAFGERDKEFLEQVAAALAQAVQNAAANKALQEEKKRLQVLLDVSSVLTSNWNVQDSFSTISAYLRRVLRHECAFFSLYEQENNVFVRQAQDFPLGKGLLAGATPVFRGGPYWLAIAEQRPVIFSKDDVEGFRSEAPLAEWANSFLAEGLKSMCCVPLLRPKGPLGTLTLASTRPDAFALADTDLLNQVAAQLATALENAGISREVDELNRRMLEEKRYLQGEPNPKATFEGIVGDTPGLRHVLDQVATVACTDATALILGETGTGKELVARAIHQMSGRRERSFIKLNCAAIPSGLLESELFGHEKGAFTGAIHQKIGRMELADHGTLFLDEIGEIPLELQPKLLRVLQDHEFERLGGVRTIKVDLRILAATNRLLGESVARGDFRSDLFYRLNVFPIRVPALRERRHDIPLLVRHFVHKFAGQMNRKIESVPTETMQALIDYSWPGNVRELENLIERSVILSKGPTLLVPLTDLAADSPHAKAADTLENAEREHIIRVIRETRGVISGPAGAAHRLGLKRTTLQSKMQRLGITRKDY
jgi:formate hydrogenlyase transcriptional activator